jgi:single-stranded-DNA-specific exonuclease
MNDNLEAFKEQAQRQFRAFVERCSPDQRIVVLCHSDADGLAAGAILARTLLAHGYHVITEVTGKGGSAWSDEARSQLMAHAPEVLIIADLGSRAEPVLPDVPTLLVDHHQPEGVPPGAELITGYGLEPTPTTGLLAYWCVETLGPADDLLWIAAVSILSDVGDAAPFSELEAAKTRWKATPLRDATTLLNAPRRAAKGDARPALDLLMRAEGPRDIVRGDAPEVPVLKAAKQEVNAAFAEAKRAAPRFSGEVAIVMIDTPCQIHPLIAQIWRTRLPKYLVMSANRGYLPGRVNFSARAGVEHNVLQFLRDHAPAGADASYGHGHDQASGGSLTFAAWNQFITDLGFGDDLLVQ